jgi:hypothetical protein
MKKHNYPLLLLVLMALWLAQPARAGKTDTATLINQAGLQRMLSQRIAKAYFFLGAKVRPDKARRQLATSLEQFEKNQKLLITKIQEKEIQDVLSFQSFAFTEFKALVTQPYNSENGALVLDLSETLLETSHDVVLKLEALSKRPKDRIVNLAGRQRMLSQRIAKFYIAYRLGFRDENSIYQLNQAVEEFQNTLKLLQEQKRNTREINSILEQVQKYWNLVKGFFLDIKRGGLPVTVFAATDKITELMDQATRLYVETGSNKNQQPNVLTSSLKTAK